MELSDLTSAINILDTSLKAAKSTLASISAMPKQDEDDAFTETIKPFIHTAEPQLATLWKMHADVRAEWASLLIFFGEDESAKAEELFSTVVAFSSSLNRAAAEQTKHLVKPVPEKQNKQADGGINLLLAAQRTGASDAQGLTPQTSHTSHTAQPSGTSTGSSASTLKDVSRANKASETDARPRRVSSGAGALTLARNNPLSRQTLSRGQLDEAIRSIHEGAKRRDRTMRGQGGRGSVVEGVRLSKMMLDGTQGGTRRSRFMTLSRGTVAMGNSVNGLPRANESLLSVPKISGSPGRQLRDTTFRVPS